MKTWSATALLPLDSEWLGLDTNTSATAQDCDWYRDSGGRHAPEREPEHGRRHGHDWRLSLPRDELGLPDRRAGRAPFSLPRRRPAAALTAAAHYVADHSFRKSNSSMR